jgi:hypothetical protein
VNRGHIPEIAENYLARDGKGLRTADQRRAMLQRLVYGEIGDKHTDANGPVMADRTLATIRKVLNWHASRS